MTQCFPVQSLSNRDAENRVTNKIAERPCLASLFASNHPSCGQNYPKVRFLLKRAIQVNLIDTWVLNRKSETSNSVVLALCNDLGSAGCLSHSCNAVGITPTLEGAIWRRENLSIAQPMMGLQETLHGSRSLESLWGEKQHQMVLRGVNPKQIPCLEIESNRIFIKTLTPSETPKSIRNNQAVTCKVQRMTKV